jgi:O-methyltransferase
MRNAIKNLVLSTIPPVQRLYQNRDELFERTRVLEAENRELQAALQARASRVPPNPLPFDFDADGMKLWDKNLKSLGDPRFTEAYAKGTALGVHIEFRAYVCCWAAAQAARLPGDFVECGVNEGWLSLTICHFLDFNSLGKAFYLFDTYSGIPAEQISERERERAALHHYVDCYEATKAKFVGFPNARLVRGRIPETLPAAPVDKVSYLSIDMNIAKPERDAIEFFWPKLSRGGIVVLDDYAFGGYDAQHETMDEFASSVGVGILTLPTGQGLIVKQ